MSKYLSIFLYTSSYIHKRDTNVYVKIDIYIFESNNWLVNVCVQGMIK